jgi:hypothetical protein
MITRIIQFPIVGSMPILVHITADSNCRPPGTQQSILHAFRCSLFKHTLLPARTLNSQRLGTPRLQVILIQTHYSIEYTKVYNIEKKYLMRTSRVCMGSASAKESAGQGLQRPASAAPWCVLSLHAKQEKKRKIS